MMTHDEADLDTMAANIVSALPKLDSFEQRLSLELYCLLTLGQPSWSPETIHTTAAAVAKKLGIDFEADVLPEKKEKLRRNSRLRVPLW